MLRSDFNSQIMQMNFEYNLLAWLVLKYILLCVHKAGDELSRKSVGIKIQVEKMN